MSRDYILNFDKKELKENDNALVCELGFYVGTKKDIDEYIKRNLMDKIDCQYDDYFMFYMFCKFVVEKFNECGLTDIYSFIEQNYIRLVGLFLTEKCKNKEEIDLFEKVNNIIKEKNLETEKDKDNYLKIIANCFGNVEKHFDRFTNVMKLIKMCYDNNIIDFHNQEVEDKLCNVNKFVYENNGTCQKANLGYFCTIRTDKKMEDIKLFSYYKSDEYVRFTNMNKDFKVVFENGKLYLCSNVEDNFKVDLEVVDLSNEVIQKYCKEFALVCMGFEHIIDYIIGIENIIKSL